MEIENLSKETKDLLDLIKSKQKMVAMVAPSFVIDFNYPEIIGMLRRVGFDYVAEVSRGAIETNKQLNALMKLHPDKRWITSPCPTVVRTIRHKYPQLVQYLAPIDSPMSALGKIMAKDYPDYKKVHICPCLVKKFECYEDYPELDILSVTYKEMATVFEILNIKPDEKDKDSRFDIIGKETRLYPISGGLAQSAKVAQNLTDEQFDVISGPVLVDKFLREEFLNKPELKLVDILNCEGGCINGPGVITKEPLQKRREKVMDYWSNNQKDE